MVKILGIIGVLIFISSPFFNAKAQTGYVPESVWSNINPATGLAADFILKVDGSKLFGEIIKNYDYSDYLKVDFESNGTVNSYLPEDLKAFGLANGRFFMSKIVADSSNLEFVQILFSGRLQLDYSKGKYYLDNGSDVQELRTYYQDTPGPGSPKNRYVKLYISTLKINTSGNCGVELIDLIEESKLNEPDLINILTQYHQCENLPYQLHVVKIPFVKFSPTFSMGVGSNFTNSLDIPKNLNYSFRNSLSYKGFAGLRLHDFRRFPKSSLDLRVGYINHSTVLDASYDSNEGLITATQEFIESSFVLPLIYNFSFIKKGDTEIYFGLALAAWINSIKTNFAIVDHNYLLNDNEIALLEGSFLSVPDYSVVPGIKLGINLPIKEKTTLFAEIQAEYLKDFYSVSIVNLPAFSITRSYISFQAGFEF
tara:strand:- start:556 stop:1830 length:1275 start_codon:yes stop_codon:yes gene_type:complete